MEEEPHFLPAPGRPEIDGAEHHLAKKKKQDKSAVTYKEKMGASYHFVLGSPPENVQLPLMAVNRQGWHREASIPVVQLSLVVPATSPNGDLQSRVAVAQQLFDLDIRKHRTVRVGSARLVQATLPQVFVSKGLVDQVTLRISWD